jgi:hypothetical protein
MKGRHYKHGHSSNGTTTREYNSWSSMHRRCRNLNSPDYKRYGAKGIKICKEWYSFEQFLADMGNRPEGYTLHRVDNNGDYTPENCVWASVKEQAIGRNNTRYIRYKDVIKPLSEWTKEFGFTRSLFYYYSYKGLTDQDALTIVIDKCQGV